MGNFKLHKRVARLLIAIAVVSSIFYSSFVWLTVANLEDAMLSTLVGHEIGEIVLNLAENPDADLPNTAAMRTYLLSRDAEIPIPDFLKNLQPNFHSSVSDGDKHYQVAVIEQGKERIFLSFDITHIEKYGNILLAILVGGILLTASLLIAAATWVSRRFLLPVSELAEEVANIDPNERNVRIEERYRDYEVGLIARSIDQFMDRMDDFVQREQSFTSAVSHELRTPIAVISTATELLELGDSLSDTQQRTIHRIKASTQHMQDTIETLLFFARESERVKPARVKEVPVSEVVEEVIADYQDGAAEKGLDLQLEIESQIRAGISPNHLALIVGNLVQNAVQYTAEGSIRIILDSQAVRVADTGRGLQQVEIDRICERCYKGVDSPGCGLGLYLVSRLCEYYGFTLDIDSEPGRGSQFSVVFSGSG